MKIRTISLSVILLLVSLPLFATDCDYKHIFCGQLFKAVATPTGWTNVPAPAGWYVYITGGPNETDTTSCNFQGQNCNFYQSGTFAWTTGCGPYTQYQLTVTSWDGWGGQGVPLMSWTQPANCVGTVPNTVVPPGPLPPSIEVPASGALVYSTTTSIIWRKSADADRDSPSWPITYEVRLKNWPSGTSEPPDQNSDIIYTGACPAWGTSECKLSDVLLPNTGNYRVKIRASMDVSATVPQSLRPAIYRNSHSLIFSVPSAAARLLPVGASEMKRARLATRPLPNCDRCRLVHSAHAARAAGAGCWRLLVFLDLGDESLGGEHQAGDG